MQPHNTQQETAPRSASIRTGLPGRIPPVPAILKAAPNAQTLTRCLGRRLGLALGLGVLLAAGAGVGAWFFAPQPKHQVRTLVQVPPGQPYVVRTGETIPDIHNHQRNQVAVARSRLVLNSALKDPAVASLPIITSRIDVNEWLEKELQVDFSIAPEIMRISLNGVEIDELIKLVDGIRRAYIREVIEKGIAARRERMDYLATLIQKYDDQLKLARNEQRNIEEQVGGKSADVRGRMLSFLQQSLSLTESELLSVQSQLRQNRLAVEGVKAREAKGEPVPVSPRLIADALAKAPEIASYNAEIHALQQKMAQTAKRSALGEQAPAYLRNQRDIASLRQKIEQASGRLRPDLLKQVQEQARLDAQTGANVLQARIDNLVTMEKTLEGETERLRTRVIDLSKKNVRLDSFREDVSHIEAFTKRFKSEHEALKVELSAPSQVRILEEATVMKVNIELRKWLMTGGAALAAFCFALFGVSWMEHRFRRVGTVDDVVQGLGMRLVGTVPDTRKLRRSGSATVSETNRQVLADSVDAARTLLLHLARNNSVRTVMVTSAVAGEGKTSLSCHLAASLARAGLKTLLVDADIRNPRVHKLFGVPGDVGFTETLLGQSDAAAAIRPTSVRGLSVMPAGRWSDEMCQALNRGSVITLFERLRQEYDMILVDSSPVLPVSDSLLVGQQVDGVLLSVLCEFSRLNNVYAAWQRIEDLGIPTLGAVVSGVSGSVYGSAYSYNYARKN